MKLVSLLTLVAASCAVLPVPLPASAAEAAASAPAAAAAVLQTGAGHPFTLAADFTVQRKDRVVTLTAPEGDARVHIVDVDATSADDAVSQAWALVRPDFKRPLLLATPRPPRNGWEEQRSYEYESSPNERVLVQALARRAGSAWVVILLDGNEGTFEKRSAPVGQMLGSLRPKGYQRENFAGRKPHPLDEARIATLKSFLAQGMRDLDVPGVGFSLIDGQRVVFEGGLGVRALGRPEPVDARTLFMAASNTKAMSTVLLAQAVDAGRLRWDQPAAEAYPAFRLGDSEVTRQVLIKHLVCACTGMPRQDMEWLFASGKARPSTTFDQLATMKPTSRFGEVFQYSNLMVAAGGYIAAAALQPGIEVGAAYDRAMRERVFKPLGMDDTTFDIPTAMRGNHAEPHGDDLDGRTRRASMSINNKIGSARPAGAVWTSPHDFSRYVLMELARGRNVQGERIVSEENLLQRYAPQVLVGEDVQYGMGLFIDRHEGITVVHHGGDLLGYHSDMIWLPEFGIGATILTNSDSGVLLRGPFLRKLLELLFDGKPEADERLRLAALNRRAEAEKQRARLTLPVPRPVRDGLAARYRSAELGGIRVLRQGATVRFQFDDWSSEVALRKNQDGTESLVTIDPGIAGIEFVRTQDAGERGLVLRDAQHEYRYTATAPRR